jgi:hypothetical protein
LIERSDNGSIIEKEEKIMTKKYEGAAKLYNDAVNENDALVQAMIGESNIHWKVGYLESFLASAMYDMPELKERVESRILQRIKLQAMSNKAA